MNKHNALAPGLPTPIYWNELLCKLRALNTTLANTSSGNITSQVVAVPNEFTGVYDFITYTYTDGVLTSSVTEPSTYPVAQQITKDVEYVANHITGFYDKIVHTYINGVLQPDVVTPTIYPVSGLPPAQVDFEWICDVNTGFLTEIEIITDALGVSTKTYTPTTITCEKTCAPLGVLGQLNSWSQIL